MNNKKLLGIAALALSIGVSAQQKLTVNVTNLKPGKGTVNIGIFNKEKGFLKDGMQFQKKNVKVNGASVSYTFENLPAGDYAVALYQDENSNGKCDRNFIGLPTEGYGFSNNVHPKVAPPSFGETKVSLTSDRAVTIKLIR